MKVKKMLALAAAVLTMSCMPVNIYADKLTTKDGLRYVVSDSGEDKGLYTGWTKNTKTSKRFYYIDGVKRKGWTYIYDKNNWYYFDTSNGSLATGTVEIDGAEYTFASDGAWEGKTNIGSAKAYSTLKKKLSKNDYGGIYLDESSVVVLSVNDEKVQKAIDEVKKDFPQITLKHCKYSVNELESVYNYLGNKMDHYKIMGLSTDVMNNRILVQMEKSNKEFEEYIDSLKDSDIIYVEYGDFRLIDD